MPGRFGASGAPGTPRNPSAARAAMVTHQLARRGILDARVLAALARVPRHEFVPDALADLAYGDSPLPIGAGQTISQPFVVALMCEALAVGDDHRVLEIGTGCGYAAAVLGELAARVCTIERHESLAAEARARLLALGYDHVEVRLGDGRDGWPEEAPFDGIAVAAGDAEVPAPLLRQLAVGGRLVMPVGDRRSQNLVRVTRTGEDSFERVSLGAVRFVPLVHAGPANGE